MPVEIRVKFNAKAATREANVKLQKDFTIMTKDYLGYLRFYSPIRSGLFRRSWKAVISNLKAKIFNPQPYAVKLEKGGSEQAKKGILRPAQNALDKKYNGDKR
jgi:hypothetical protein